MTGERPLLVVVTGPPAAGKSTVAAALRHELGLPLLAKDAIKETLADTLGTRGRHDSRALGVATFHLLDTLVRELLAAGVSLICEGNFRAGALTGLPDARVVQVHVSAPPETLHARLLARDPQRHPVHYDAEAADEIRAGARAGEWEPLPLGGGLVRVHGTEPFKVNAVAGAILELEAHRLHEHVDGDGQHE